MVSRSLGNSEPSSWHQSDDEATCGSGDEIEQRFIQACEAEGVNPFAFDDDDAPLERLPAFVFRGSASAAADAFHDASSEYRPEVVEHARRLLANFDELQRAVAFSA